MQGEKRFRAIELLLVFEHAEDGVEQFPHDDDNENAHLGLAASAQMLIEGAHVGLIANGD